MVCSTANQALKPALKWMVKCSLGNDFYLCTNEYKEAWQWPLMDTFINRLESNKVEFVQNFVQHCDTSKSNPSLMFYQEIT